MARPPIKKRVCAAPLGLKFGLKGEGPNPVIEMSVEQLEVLRLIDHQNLNQEEAASEMGIARTSVQKLYHEARIKIASALFDKKDVLIKGGKYTVHKGAHCNHHEDNNMEKIAIITDGDFVSKHFGRAKSYVLVTLQNNHITNKEVINLDESHCNHQETLLSLALNAIISGGMGEKPYERFMENGIKVLYAEGNIDDVIKEYSLGKLSNLSPHSHNH